MSRVLPHPVLSGALLAMWLLLHHSVAPASLLGGTVLALLAPHAYAALEKAPLRIGSVRRSNARQPTRGKLDAITGSFCFLDRTRQRNAVKFTRKSVACAPIWRIC